MASGARPFSGCTALSSAPAQARGVCGPGLELSHLGCPSVSLSLLTREASRNPFLPEPSPASSIMTYLSLQNYFRDAWNVFDFVTVLGSITDILVTEIAVSSLSCPLRGSSVASFQGAPSSPGAPSPPWGSGSGLG